MPDPDQPRQWHGSGSLPYRKYRTVLILSMFLKPLAQRLTPENRLLRHSRKPFVSLLEKCAMTPSKWLAIMFATFSKGASSLFSRASLSASRYGFRPPFTSTD